MTLKPLVDPQVLLVWRYLSTFSRPRFKEESTPYRVSSFRLFKALHPGVKFSQLVHINNCASCHPSAKEFNFRRLSEGIGHKYYLCPIFHSSSYGDRYYMLGVYCSIWGENDTIIRVSTIN